MEAVSPARLRGPFRVKTIVAKGGLVLRTPPRCTGEPGTPSPAPRPPAGASVLHVSHRVCGEGWVGAGLEAVPRRPQPRAPASGGRSRGRSRGRGRCRCVPPFSLGAQAPSGGPAARTSTGPSPPPARGCRCGPKPLPVLSRSRTRGRTSPRDPSSRGLGRRRPCSARPRLASEDPSPRFPSAAQGQATRGIDRTCRSAFAPEQRGRRSAARA